MSATGVEHTSEARAERAPIRARSRSVDLRPPAVPLEVALQRAQEQSSTSAYIQDALAVDLAAATDAQLFGVQPSARNDLPDPHEWTRSIGQAIVEVMSGMRAPAQLVRWCNPEVYAVIARRNARATRRRIRSAAPRGVQRPLVVAVRVCEPADGVAECAIVVREGTRVRAVAVRLVGGDGRWRVEEFQIG